MFKIQVSIITELTGISMTFHLDDSILRLGRKYRLMDLLSTFPQNAQVDQVLRTFGRYLSSLLLILMTTVLLMLWICASWLTTGAQMSRSVT